ncbi:ABC transporter ATP-binding protein [Kiloniella sp. EL199]|uniref:ABC transporter ATP-binding protein n=1 Tax=Kiloniella sp. EL199 TaxID=2107581 RepID=UPI000EA34541|nr:sn-glycerol-3-phosphate ABC transporter ATP-binding protein UgpC [Kiloniella sp. EL199]
MSAVTLNNFSKSYGKLSVLSGIDLTINSGEFIALVGPSGCGKSTLLRMIAGLEEITSGNIQIGERTVTDLAPKDRNIAMVFQSYALYPHLSVRSNMGFSLKLRKVTADKITTAINNASTMLGLDQLLERLPKALSGGQRQRVAMGRAIVRRPDVFLFDEPLSNLDAKLRVQMRSEIKSLHQDIKTTSIYVTHDQIEAMTMADRIVVMNKGNIEQAGAPLDIYDRPESKFVAGFIGSPAMNFFTAEYKQNESNGTIDINDECKIAIPKISSIQQGTVECGIRPEHLTLSQEKGQDHNIKVTVDVVEPTGLATIVYLSFGKQKICFYTSDRPDIRPRDTVYLEFSENNLHLFDINTGKRLN